MSFKKLYVAGPTISPRSSLTLTQYKPNLADPRLRKRLQQVLNWCGSMLLARRPISIHHDKLRKVFGNTGRNPGRWLYAKLLHQVGGYAPGQRSYSYVLNADGYERLHKLCGIELRSISEIAAEKYADVVDGALPLHYADSGDRRYHSVQNLKREVRASVFDGWWDYDIDACAPTLLYQYVSEGRGEGWGEKWLPTIRQLAFEKETIRQHVRYLTGLEELVAKRLLNAIFFRAVLAPHSASAVFQILGGSEELLYRLRGDALIKALRREVRFMWQLAHNRYSLERISMANCGKKVFSLSDSKPKQRNAIYRMLERKVINAMEDVLPTKLLGCVLMHDGFMLKNRANVSELQNAVRQRTGYIITLKEVCLCRHETSDEPDPLEDAAEHYMVSDI